MQNNFTYRVTKTADSTWMSLTLVKDYLRISENHDDELLKTITSAAIQAAEHFIRISLYKRDVLIKSNPTNNITLPLLPVMAEVKIIHEPALLLDEDYVLDIQAGKIKFLHRAVAPLSIEYSAGYSDEDFPAAIKSGILMHIAEIYDRQGLSPNIPQGAKALYSSYRKLIL